MSWERFCDNFSRWYDKTYPREDIDADRDRLIAEVWD
jgi:hypothetical protein